MEAKLMQFAFPPCHERPLLEGRITAMLRTKTHGAQTGDTFYAGRTGLRCLITSIRPVNVGPGAEMYHQSLGYDTAQGFLAFWREMHPYIGNDLTRVVFLISFEPEAQ